MKKLKAFTLMELLVGMIVSSIVIGFGYSAGTVIYRQFLSYKKAKMEILMTAQFMNVFGNDWYHADVVVVVNDGIEVGTSSKLIRYEFKDTIMLRKTEEICDTFNLACKDLRIAMLSPGESLISAVSFESGVLGEEAQFEFSKKYSAATLLEQEILNEN
jgi:prepilin-type N-terminal cleavage/methylation domain-containing protein